MTSRAPLARRAIGFPMVVALLFGVLLGSVTTPVAAAHGSQSATASKGNPHGLGRLDVAVPGHGHVHIFPTVKENKRLKDSGALPAPAPGSPSPTAYNNLLTYASGPVMNTSKIYTIYWLPNGYHFEGNYDGNGPNSGDASYQTILNDFAGHLGGTSFYDILTQYPSLSGALTDSSSFGGTWVDTTAYPCGTTCGDTNTSGHYLSDGDIVNEVVSAVNHNSWPSGTTNLYLVYYGFGVQSCAGSNFCSTNAYCAYHSDFSNGGHTYLYANEFDDGPGTDCHISGQGTPNGDAYADYTANVTSHEVFEAISDPTPRNGWDDPSTNDQYGQDDEIGDMCAWVSSKMGNVTLNDSSKYFVQGEWSNNVGDCALSANITTALAYSGPTQANPGQSITVSATLTDNNSLGVGEQKITFSLGTSTCSGTTQFAAPGTSTGKASCNLSAPSTPGSYTLTATFAGLGAYQNSGASTPFGVSQIVTQTSYTGPTSGDYNDAVTLTGHLQDTSANAISGKVLSLGFAAESCTGTTDTSGNASCSVTPLDNVSGSPYPITASFAGDATYTASSDSSQSFTVNQEDTKLTYTGPSNADYNDPVTLAATLSDPNDNTGIAGKSVTLGFGAESCNGTTNASGKASCTVTPADSAGPYTVTASFTDASGNFANATTTSPFTVNLEDTTLTAAALPTFVATGQNVTLKATLTDTADGTGIPGKTITMQLGATGPSCNGTTAAPSGTASCQVTVPSSIQGPQTATYTFTADAYDAGATDSNQTIAFSFLPNGTFMLGDVTAQTDSGTSATATWWSSQWNKLNQLSKGNAPSQLKGFASNLFDNGTAVSQLSCATTTFTYLTGGGNSANPPASVPAYMAVAVSSHINGQSNLGGNVVHIYIVRTNDGYQPDPSYPGTGTVIGQLC